MSSSESDSDISYKRAKKRHRSRSRSHKNSKKSKKVSRSRDRSSSRNSRHKSSKDSRRHRSSRDNSSKHVSSRRSSSKKRSKESSMHLPSRDTSSRNSRDKKQKKNVEKIDTKEQIKKALLAAATVDDQLHKNFGKENGEIDFSRQRQRAEEINDIEKGDFTQSDFKSSRSEIPMPKESQVDASHASAMFGSYEWKDNVSKSKNKDGSINELIQMMHPILLEDANEKFEKWKEKLFLMRKTFLKSNKGQLPWQIQ